MLLYNRERKNIWQTNFSNIAQFDFADFYHYHENTKQVKNKFKKNKRIKTGHLMSHFAPCFKYVQNLILFNLVRPFFV